VDGSSPSPSPCSASSPASSSSVDADGLGELFWTVARELRHRTRDALTPWQITPAQFRALSVLIREEPQRITELAEHLRIAPRSATEVVDHLERSGLVERRPDAADRRATLVGLTGKGRAAGDDLREARQAEAGRFFGSLSEEDRQALAEILRKLVPAGDQAVKRG
jgi:DNA-binding MarR family transcriptional regulator